MRIHGDYGGTVALWNASGIAPQATLDFAEFIKAQIPDTSVPLVEVGAGRCLLAAVLAQIYKPYYAVDHKFGPMADGQYTPVTVDARTRDFRDTLDVTGVRTIVGRRSLCLLLSPTWLDLIEGAVDLIISEGLNNERQTFPNATSEAIYLRDNGWTVDVTGLYLVARR